MFIARIQHRLISTWFILKYKVKLLIYGSYTHRYILDGLQWLSTAPHEVILRLWRFEVFKSYTQHRIRRKTLYFVYGGYWWDVGSWLNDDARLKDKWKTSNGSHEARKVQGHYRKTSSVSLPPVPIDFLGHALRITFWAIRVTKNIHKSYHGTQLFIAEWEEVSEHGPTTRYRTCLLHQILPQRVV